MDNRKGARRQTQKDCGVPVKSIWNVNAPGKIGYLRFLDGEPIPYGYMLAIRNARSEILSDMPRSSSESDRQSMIDSIHEDFKVRKARPDDRPLRHNETTEYFMNLREKRKRAQKS